MKKNESMVTTKNLTKIFGHYTAVDSVTIKVKKGEIFGFLGANGAGKTTTIRMLCGILKPSSGNGWVAGYDVNNHSEDIKKNIGYMSQKFSLYDDLRVIENLRFYGSIYGLNKKEIGERKDYFFNKTGLSKIERTITKSLPLGFKQRLALVCSILHNPPVIFLDEPTSGIDPKARREFWKIIYELSSEGKTIFVTTHYMDEAEYCNRVSIMRMGKIIALDNPGELSRKYGGNMQDVFMRIVGGNDEK